MQRVRRLVASAAVLTITVAAVPLVAQQHSPVMGAWVVEALEIDGTPVADAQPGLIIFTSTHYSIMFSSAAGARALYEGENMTDAETVAAYGTFVANSGRYEVAGNEVITRAYVAKDPNYMGGWPENAANLPFRIEGDRMYLEWAVFKFTLRRVEGSPVPW